MLQSAVQYSLAELALVYARVDHATALDHCAKRMARHRAQGVLERARYRRNVLPPGCRMTATHFLFK